MSSPAIAASPSTSAVYSANDCPSVDHASLMSPATPPLGPPPSVEERPLTEPAQDAGPGVDGGAAVAVAPAEAPGVGRGVQEALDLGDEVAGDLDDAGTLVAERRHGDAPPLVHRAEQRGHRYLDVLEDQLGEVALAGRLHDRAAA